MARMHTWLGLAALAFFLTGCVSADKYNALKMDNESLSNQLADANAKVRAAEAQNNLYKSQFDSAGQNAATKDGLVANLMQQKDLLAAENAELKRKYEEALNRPVSTGAALPAPVSSALDEFARTNADLIDFDASRGIVKFKSDLTFALGSADLTDKAKQAIGRFAQILNSPAAASYELMVAGHTDNTPVVNPATKTKHPNNWYLSSHRAISVADALMSQQVSAQRVGVTGYGDQRPIANNSSLEGKAQNRRVEVMILPSTVRVAKVSTPAAKPAPARKPALNKDTVAPLDNRPVLNK